MTQSSTTIPKPRVSNARDDAARAQATALRNRGAAAIAARQAAPPVVSAIVGIYQLTLHVGQKGVRPGPTVDTPLYFAVTAAPSSVTAAGQMMRDLVARNFDFSLRYAGTAADHHPDEPAPSTPQSVSTALRTLK